MRISLLCATLVAGMLLANTSAVPVLAQGTTGTNVVVLDVGKVFKEHNRFNQALEVMKGDVSKFEKYLQDQRAVIQKMVDELKQKYKPGTPEYNAREAEIAKKTSDIQVDTGLKRKEFMQKEAKLYYNTYTDVTNAVKKFAVKYNIELVLRFNGDEIKQDDPKTIIAGVNSSVVYQNKRDITAAIIAEVNRGGRQAINNGGGGPQIPGGINR